MKKSNVLIALIMLPLALIALQGCNSTSNTTSNTTTTSNAVQTLSSKAADSDPGALSTSLLGDITRLFKTADDEPIAVEEGDSLTDVFNRTGG